MASFRPFERAGGLVSIRGHGRRSGGSSTQRESVVHHMQGMIAAHRRVERKALASSVAVSRNGTNCNDSVYIVG